MPFCTDGAPRSEWDKRAKAAQTEVEISVAIQVAERQRHRWGRVECEVADGALGEHADGSALSTALVDPELIGAL